MYNLSFILEDSARSYPEREALVLGDVRLTYAQVNAQANRVANVGLRGGRLIQLDAATAHRASVSCALVKHRWAQGEDTRVAWVQSQFGKTVSVARPTPLKGCHPQT